MASVADTYTGVVFGEKNFHSGGVAVDLDGRYPNQKMTLYIAPGLETAIGKLPPIGAKVTAMGTVTQYHGKSEIKITSAGQLSW